MIFTQSHTSRNLFIRFRKFPEHFLAYLSSWSINNLDTGCSTFIKSTYLLLETPYITNVLSFHSRKLQIFLRSLLFVSTWTFDRYVINIFWYLLGRLSATRNQIGFTKLYYLREKLYLHAHIHTCTEMSNVIASLFLNEVAFFCTCFYPGGFLWINRIHN